MGWESYQLANRVIALTTWERRLMKEQFSAPDGKVVVIPNGVVEKYFQDTSLYAFAIRVSRL